MGYRLSSFFKSLLVWMLPIALKPKYRPTLSLCCPLMNAILAGMNHPTGGTDFHAKRKTGRQMEFECKMKVIPPHGLGRYYPKAATGHDCITVLLLRAVKNGGLPGRISHLAKLQLLRYQSGQSLSKPSRKIDLLSSICIGMF